MKHETRNTTHVLAWCNFCGERTLHLVSDRKVGRCVNPHAEGLSRKQELAKKKREAEAQNLRLF